MKARDEWAMGVFRAVSVVGLGALLLVPVSGQPQPMAGPGFRRNLGPSAYDGYAVPAEILAGKAAEWLAAEAVAAGALPPEQRHAKRVDRILAAAVAARAAGAEDDAAWGSKAYGDGTPAAKAFAGFGELLAGRAENLIALAATLAGENLQGGWRNLALGLRRAAEAKPGQLIHPQAVLALYLLGMPYPGSGSDVEGSAMGALRYFGGAPADAQKAVVDAVIKAKSEPACREYLTRLLPAFLESMFRNRQTQCAELGRLMVMLTDHPGQRSSRTALLPESMGASRNDLVKDAARETALSGASPSRRLSAAETLLRQGDLKSAYEAYCQLETGLPEDTRPLAWTGQYRALAGAAQKGVDLGTTIAAEREKRTRALAAAPGPLTQAALADLEYMAGDKAAGLAAYAALIKSPQTPPILSVATWTRIALDDPAKAWELLPAAEGALAQPAGRLGNSPEITLILTGLAQGQPAATADVLARMRPQRAKTWQVGNEAALRLLAGQADAATALLDTLDTMDAGASELNQFCALAVAPRAPVTASEGPLRKAAADGLAKCHATDRAWSLAARCAVRLLQARDSANAGTALWGDLMRRLPATPRPEDQQMATELSRGLVESTKAYGMKSPGQFVNLLECAGQPLRSQDGARCFPYALEVFSGGLREGKAVEMTERHAEGAIKRFVAGMQAAKAPADAYAKLSQAVAGSYPTLAGAVAAPPD